MTREELIALSKTAARHYRPFYRQKPDGSGARRIDNPVPPLKGVQKLINQRLLIPLMEASDFPTEIIGGVRGRSTRDSQVHAGSMFIFRMDLRGCFPTTGPEKVLSVLKSRLLCRGRVATRLMQLTTFQKRLPQGASTSNSILNLILWDIHDSLRGLLRENKLSITYYVDDITISGGEGLRDLIDQLIGEIYRHGYRIQNRKTKLIHNSKAQVVTGVSLNKQRVKCERLIVQETRREILELGFDREVSAEVSARILGRISYIRHICESQARALERRIATQRLRFEK